MATLVARQIWHRWNSVVFGGMFSSPKALLRVVKEQYRVFIMVSKHNGRQGQVPQRRRQPHGKNPWRVYSKLTGMRQLMAEERE